MTNAVSAKEMETIAALERATAAYQWTMVVLVRAAVLGSLGQEKAAGGRS